MLHTCAIIVLRENFSYIKITNKQIYLIISWRLFECHVSTIGDISIGELITPRHASVVDASSKDLESRRDAIRRTPRTT